MMEQAVRELLDVGNKSSDAGSQPAMTNEMQQSRLNILRKGLIGPEIEQIHKVIDQKISLALQEFKDEINFDGQNYH